MTLRVHISNGRRIGGILYYTESEYSFRFASSSPADLAIDAGSKGTTSIAIGTFQIEVGVETRRALFGWGLHPCAKWLNARLNPPKAREGHILIDAAYTLKPGVTLEVAPAGAWSTTYDPELGWIRLAADDHHDDETIEIATSTLLGVLDNQLHSIWVNPIFE
jgi:hypothetical protein